MNNLPPESKEKNKTIDQLLDDEYVLLHINSCEEGTTLPDHLMNNPFITLKLSRLFRGGVELTAEHIESDLLFGDRYFSCIIPYRAIWGATSAKGNNIIWPESTPEEVLGKILSRTKATEVEASAPRKVKKKPAAKVSKIKAPHLKRVK